MVAWSSISNLITSFFLFTTIHLSNYKSEMDRKSRALFVTTVFRYYRHTNLYVSKSVSSMTVCQKFRCVNWSSANYSKRFDISQIPSIIQLKLEHHSKFSRWNFHLSVTYIINKTRPENEPSHSFHGASLCRVARYLVIFDENLSFVK